MNIYFQLSPATIAALGVCVIAVIYITTVYRCYFLKMTRSQNTDNTEKPYPALSVIIYARNNAEELGRLMPVILNQEYPEKIRIIIVNDGENEDVKDVYKFYSHKYDNISTTFVPADAKALSRRKLAMTLGIKAAQTNHLLFIDADTVPASDNWIKKMAAPFCNGKEVVLGRNCYPSAEFARECGIMSRFCWLTTLTAWINSALGGHPYRGDIRNIGFTKDIFSSNRGFANILNLYGGTDDIFISEIANGSNCECVISPDALTTTDKTVNIRRDWNNSKRSHFYTSRRLSKWSRRMIMSGAIALWFFTGASAMSLFINPLSPILISAIAVLGMTIWITVSLTFKKLARFAMVRIPSWLSPMLLMLYPMDIIINNISAFAHRREEHIGA